MCGIAGFISRQDAYSQAGALRRVAAALAHRGPDGSGTHCAGPVGLAQTRLSIIGLATGHQTMVSEDGALALVANGEVYNYVELNGELRQRGRRRLTDSDSDSDSDSETILHAYAALGHGFLAELRGMYAFASEPKALLALVPQAPRPHARSSAGSWTR